MISKVKMLMLENPSCFKKHKPHISIEDVEDSLISQLAYALHKPICLSFKTRPFVVHQVDGRLIWWILAQFVKRLNRTIKGIMFQYFTKKNTRRYIDILQAIASKYNVSYHKSIRMVPKDFNNDKETQVWINLYEKDSPIIEKNEVNLV